MKRLFAIVAAVAVVIAPCARAEDAQKPKITVAQALSLLAALRNLDGHVVAIKQGASDATVMIPWDFGSGLLRLKIANDISILSLNEKSAEDARQGVIKEIVKGLPEDKRAAGIQAGTPEFSVFQAQYGEALNAPAQGTQDLARIKASELKLDKNEIGGTTISGLMPILDIDVPLK